MESNLVYFRSIQTSVLKSIVEVLREIIHDGVLVFNEHGIRLTSIDVSKVSLTHLKLNADAFETFVCTTPTRAGINTQNMHKLLKSAASHDTIAMFITKSSPDILGIVIENAEKKSKTEFSLRLMDLDASDISLPASDYDAVYSLPSSGFQKICRDMSLLSPDITIESAPGQLNLSCSGDFASQKTSIGETDAMVVENITNNTSSATYALKYLTLFCKASGISNVVEIFVRADHPLVLRFACGALGELTFLLTPLAAGDDADED